MKEQVLDPLGLDQTSLPVAVEIADPVLRGYELDAPNPPEDVTTYRSWMVVGLRRRGVTPET